MVLDALTAGCELKSKPVGGGGGGMYVKKSSGGDKKHPSLGMLKLKPVRRIDQTSGGMLLNPSLGEIKICTPGDKGRHLCTGAFVSPDIF